MITKNGKTLALTEQELAIVSDILKNRPDAVIFGSRVKGISKKFSDLDICLMKPIKGYEYELLKEAFEQSDLPFTVDIVEYHRVDDDFKKIIDTESVKLAVFVD